MADRNYDPVLGVNVSFTFSPDGGGTTFGTEQAQLEKGGPAPVDIEPIKFTPISGANSNVEQTIGGKYPNQEYKFTATYDSTAHEAALTCQSNRVKGTLVVTYSDGSTDTYTSSQLMKVSPGELAAGTLRTDELTFNVPVGPSNHTFSAGTTITVVQTSQALTAGAATIDLTASPYSGGTKTPIRVFLRNLGANVMTVAKGGTNGYAGFGASFSVTLAVGQGVQLQGASALSGTNKTLDITGTGAQVLQVQVQLQ